MDHVGSIEEKNWMSKLDSPFKKYETPARTKNFKRDNQNKACFKFFACILHRSSKRYRKQK